jgi:hypothetical protein
VSDLSTKTPVNLELLSRRRPLSSTETGVVGSDSFRSPQLDTAGPFDAVIDIK